MTFAAKGVAFSTGATVGECYKLVNNYGQLEIMCLRIIGMCVRSSWLTLLCHNDYNDE